MSNHVSFELPPDEEVKATPDGYVAVASTLKAQSNVGNIIGNVIVFALGILLGIFISDSTLIGPDDKKQSDDQEQNDQGGDRKTAPKLENAWVLIIEKDANRTPQVARLLAASTYWDTLESRKIKWRHYPADAAEAKSYAAAAEKVGYPAMLILTKPPGEKSGTLVAAVPCPATTENVEELIKKVTGL